MNKLTKANCLGAAALLPLAACSTGAQKQKKADAPRPNVIVILTDDMGYSDIGCYGGEVETPVINSLAENGLRWSQFYNNARSCPSRAVLMTGLYPHQAGMGWMAAAATDGSLEYAGKLNQNCVTLAEVMDGADYETYMCGKWHLCTDRECQGECTEAWPMARGFQHFYGIPEGASHYFNARMVNGETRLEKTTDEDNFYITEALTDTAAAYIGRHDYSEKPLFMYMAFNAPHWPLHALQEDIDKNIEKYRAGWDVLREQRFARQKEMGLFGPDVELSPRDANVPAWDSLTTGQQEDFTMRMAIYAAQINAIDRGVGKIVAALKERGQFENTLIMFMDDNGACAEHISSGASKVVTGKSDTYESYRINWANLSSTPYREYKHYTNEGGIATPLIVSWPNGIDASRNGSFVREYGYFADIMATCVDVAGATYPKKFNGHKIHPCEGVSLVPNFSGEPTGRGMTFWEHEVNIAVRDGKWKLNIHHVEDEPIDLTKLELYDMDADPTELHNLASADPERAAAMLEAWKQWADRVHVYPLCTDNYGKRQQEFKRHINGGFDNKLGQWDRRSAEPAKVVFSASEEGRMTGKRCAQIDIEAKGNKPGNAVLKWMFPTDKAYNANVGFSYKASGTNHLYFRLEAVARPEVKPLDELIELNPAGGKVFFKDIALDEGRYQLCFYVGESEEGTIWIDDVILDLQSAE